MEQGSTPKVPVVFVYEGSRGRTRQEREELRLEELQAVLDELIKSGAARLIQVWVGGEG